MESRFFASGFFLLLISPLCLVHEGWRPEAAAKTTTADSVLNSEISAFNLNNETIEVGLKRLASKSAAFAMGFEHELKSKRADPPIEDPRLTLHLTATTVREALDAMCHADRSYTWSTDETFVNVYPTKTISDPSYLMNRRLTRLDLKELTDIQQGLLAIVNQLPPPREQVAIAYIGGGDDNYPPEPWTTSYENLSVRQAINRLVGHMGDRSSWAFTGSADFRAFAFNRQGFSSTRTSERLVNQIIGNLEYWDLSDNATYRAVTRREAFVPSQPASRNTLSCSA